MRSGVEAEATKGAWAGKQEDAKKGTGMFMALSTRFLEVGGPGRCAGSVMGLGCAGFVCVVLVQNCKLERGTEDYMLWYQGTLRHGFML